MLFRPRLLPTLIVLPVLALLLALGFWQLDRREWKHDLIATLEEREAVSPVALPEPVEPAALEFSRVALTGELLHERELYWTARTRDGVSGYHVLTPMRLEDGREVILDRGWLAPGDLERAGRQEALEGARDIIAYIMEQREVDPGAAGRLTRILEADDSEGATIDPLEAEARAHLAPSTNPTQLVQLGSL